MIIATEKEVHVNGNIPTIMLDLTFVIKGIAERLDNDESIDGEADIREWISLAVDTGLEAYFSEAAEFRKHIFDEVFERMTGLNSDALCITKQKGEA